MILQHLRPALFLHIPKTAGTTLIEIAAQHYGDRNCLSHSDYMKYPLENYRHVPFISGHFGYAIAGHLLAGRYSFTFLRDPIKRVLSFYSFCRTRDPDEFDIYRIVQSNSLDRFLEMALESPNEFSHVWNNQVWMLAHGWGGSHSFNDYTEARLLKLAKAHLDRLSHVGFTETFPADLRIIFANLGIGHEGALAHSNATPERLTRDGLPASTLRLLDRVTALDRELYDYARSRRSGGS